MIRRIVVVSAAAVVAGTAAALGLAAAADTWLGSTPVLVALAAVFLAQAVAPLIRSTRQPKE